MKKRSQGIVFLAVLLCLAMLLVSCKAAKTDDQGTETDAQTTEKTYAPLQDVLPDYAAALNQWKTYLTYKNYDKAPVSSATSIATALDVGSRVVTTRQDGNLIYVKTVSSTAELLGYRPYAIKHQVFNAETGARVYENNIPFDGERFLFSLDLTIVPQAGVFCVEKTVTEMTQEGLVAIKTYSYYNSNGNKLAEDLSKKGTGVVLGDGSVWLNVGGKSYLGRDGEIVRTFDYATGMDTPAEVDLEYGDYLYFAKDGELIIFDKQYNELVSFKVSDVAYNDFEFFVLSNGSVLMQASVEVLDENAAYDFEDTLGDHWKMVNKLINPAEKTVTDVALGYVIDGFASPASEDERGIALNGDYQYAEVRKIADKKLANTYDFLIVDNALATVAELPKLQKNQINGLSFIDQNLMMVPTDVMNTTVYYAIDLTKAAAALHIAEEAADDQGAPLYEAVLNGFVYRDRLYNNQLKEVYDLSELSYSVQGGVILVDDIELMGGHTVISLNENGNVLEANIPSPSVSYREDLSCFVARDVENPAQMNLYTVRGSHIISDVSEIVDVYEDSFLVRCDGVEGSATYYTIK